MEHGARRTEQNAKRKGQRRVLWLGATLLVAIVLVGAARVPILREVASFLIVEDPLRPAAAIVALGGQTPFREMEAARLYRSGFATRVFIVREAPNAESDALKQLGIKKPQTWELARAVLIQQGVPPEAIVIPKDEAIGTLEELQAAYTALGQKEEPVILVTSKYHTRRTRLTWHYVTRGRSQAIVRAASRRSVRPRALVAAAQLRVVGRPRIPRAR